MTPPHPNTIDCTRYCCLQLQLLLLPVQMNWLVNLPCQLLLLLLL
jgi:hypothetical protein